MVIQLAISSLHSEITLTAFVGFVWYLNEFIPYNDALFYGHDYLVAGAY